MIDQLRMLIFIHFFYSQILTAFAMSTSDIIVNRIDGLETHYNNNIRTSSDWTNLLLLRSNMHASAHYQHIN
jgi:hypothetical protein